MDSEEESVYNSNEDRIALSACDEDDDYPEFNELTDMDDLKFRSGMVFTSAQVFRDAVRKHAIVHQRAVKLKRIRLTR